MHFLELLIYGDTAAAVVPTHTAVVQGSQCSPYLAAAGRSCSPTTSNKLLHCVGNHTTGREAAVEGSAWTFRAGCHICRPMVTMQPASWPRAAVQAHSQQGAPAPGMAVTAAALSVALRRFGIWALAQALSWPHPPSPSPQPIPCQPQGNKDKSLLV